MAWFLGIGLDISNAAEKSSPIQVLREGEFQVKSQLVEKITIPPEFVGIEVRLESPSKIGDLDLVLFDFQPDPGTDPYKAPRKPLCLSDGPDNNEVCRVKRPQSGEIWVQVEDAGGITVPSYRLTAAFLSPDADPLLLAKKLDSGGDQVSVPDGRQDYRLELASGESALVVFAGARRKLSVSSEEGKPYPLRTTWANIQYVIIGDPFAPSRLVLTSLRTPVSLLVTVEAGTESSFGARLLVVNKGRREKGSSLPFHIPFSNDQVVSWIVKGQSNPSRSGQIGPGQMVAYRLTMEGGQGPAKITMTSEANLNIVICNQFGEMLAGGSKEISFDPRSSSDLRSSPFNPAIPRLAGSDDFYLVVLPHPLQEGQLGGNFKLTFDPKRAK